MRRPQRLDVIAEDDRWIVHEGNRVHFVYLMNGAARKPYVSMLPAPSGRNLLADAPSDHLHHHGIWWAHGDVNGIDFYLESPGHDPGHIRHRGWAEQIKTEHEVGFTEELDWVAPNGETLIKETRSLRLNYAGDTGYTLSLDSAYVAQSDLRFGTTKESGIPLIRMADAFNGRSGGVIVNSEGRKGESATFGQPARWVDYHAPVPRDYGDWEYEGLACFDHPGNPHHPNRWFTRAYGPLSPREGHHFIGEEALTAGGSFRLRHRVFVHVGDEVDGRIEEQYRAYAAT